MCASGSCAGPGAVRGACANSEAGLLSIYFFDATRRLFSRAVQGCSAAEAECFSPPGPQVSVHKQRSAGALDGQRVGGQVDADRSMGQCAEWGDSGIKKGGQVPIWCGEKAHAVPLGWPLLGRVAAPERGGGKKAQGLTTRVRKKCVVAA